MSRDNQAAVTRTFRQFAQQYAIILKLMASAFVKNIGHSRIVLHAAEREFLPEKREGPCCSFALRTRESREKDEARPPQTARVRDEACVAERDHRSRVGSRE